MSQRSLNSHENKEFFDLMLKTKLELEALKGVDA
jgi:hypothetical protein